MKRGIIIATVAASIALSAPAQAAKIPVSTTSDQFGSGSACSLREAVQSANTNAAFGGCKKGNGADVILLRAGKRYERSLAGSDDTNATGDLDLASGISLQPRQKTGKAVIDANGLSRVIDVVGARRVAISRVDLVGGVADDSADVLQGGGVFLGTGATLDYAHGAISGNRAGAPSSGTGEGGGIYSNGTLNLDRARVRNNTTPLSNSTTNGGGIVISFGTATIRSSTISHNFASNVGGGISIYAAQTRPRLIDSTVIDNDSNSVGAGMYLGEGMVVQDSTIARNHAGSAASGNADGGGIYIGDYSQPRPTVISNATIFDNSATGSGGGVAQNVGMATIRNATIAGNTADSEGDATGNYGGLSGNLAMFNSIVAKNESLLPLGAAPDCYSATGGASNLIGDPTGCSFGAPSEKDRVGGAKLGDLRNNGGPTKTLALKSGSNAIDHGSKKKMDGTTCTGSDQRGVKRPQGKRCDIGAYEKTVKKK